MTTEEKIKVMQAWLDGKIIQRRSICFGQDWYDIDFDPIWNWEEYHYRIKPEPVGIPATEEELTLLFYLQVIVKDKVDGGIKFIDSYEADHTKKKYYILNPNTKCWEDWSD